jgi:hypothetical protein
MIILLILIDAIVIKMYTNLQSAMWKTMVMTNAASDMLHPTVEMTSIALVSTLS